MIVLARALVLLMAGLPLVPASGCRTEQAQAVRAVRTYDELLIQAYRTGEVSALRAVATENEVQRVFVLIDLKRSNGLVLESVLERLQVTSAHESGEGAVVVETRERWRYYDRPLEPGRQRGQVFVANMSMRYHLVLEEGRWKVDRGETLSSSSRALKGREGIPDLGFRSQGTADPKTQPGRATEGAAGPDHTGVEGSSSRERGREQSEEKHEE